MIKHLVALYPPRWRRRYGAEILSVIEGQSLSLGVAWDLLRGAVNAWLRPDIAIVSLALAGGPGGAIFLRGIGFRPAGLWMSKPVVVERGDRTVTVRQLVATPDRTDLTYEISCLPSEAARVGRTQDEVRLRVGSQQYRISRLHAQSAQITSRRVTRTLRLEPLPLTVRRVELDVTSPILGAWSHSIALEPFSSDDTVDQWAPNRSVAHAGVTLTARTVRFTATETTVEIEAATSDDAVFTGLGGLDSRRDGRTALKLRDHRGHAYRERAGQADIDYVDPSGQVEIAIFEPVPVDAGDLELEVPFVYLEHSSGSIAIELPVAAPAIGTLGGHAIRITDARAGNIPGGAYRGPGIELTLDLGGWHNDRRVLKPRDAAMNGEPVPISILGQLRLSDPGSRTLALADHADSTGAEVATLSGAGRRSRLSHPATTATLRARS